MQIKSESAFTLLEAVTALSVFALSIFALESTLYQAAKKSAAKSQYRNHLQAHFTELNAFESATCNSKSDRLLCTLAGTSEKERFQAVIFLQARYE